MESNKVTIVFDTSALPRDYAKSGILFSVLFKLLDNELVQIYLPHVAKKEFELQQINKISGYASNIKKFNSSLMKLNASKILETDDSEMVNNLINSVEEIRSKYDYLGVKGLKSFFNKLKFEEIPIESHHGKNVMNSYFKGEPPFKNVKSRNDIPDSFIFEAIKDLRNRDLSTIYCLCNDNELFGSLSSLENTFVYRNLKQLYLSDSFFKELNKFEMEKTWNLLSNYQIPELLKKWEDKIEKDCEEILKSFLFNNDFGLFIPGDEYNDPFTEYGTIDEVKEINELKIKYDESKTMELGIIDIPFYCKAEVVVDIGLIGTSSVKKCVPGLEYDSDHMAYANVLCPLEANGYILIETTKDSEGNIAIKEIDIYEDIDLF